METILKPLLIVRNAARALDFYVGALNAKELARYLNNVQGTISHAELGVGNAVFSVTEEAREWNSEAPTSLGGSPVVLQLSVDDVDAVVDTMCEAGARGFRQPRGQVARARAQGCSQVCCAASQTCAGSMLDGRYSEPARIQYEPGSWSWPSSKSGMTGEQLKPDGHSQ